MKVKVRFLTKGATDLELREGATFREVAELAGLAGRGTLVALLNGRYAEPERELRDGDIIAVFPPVAGG